MKQPVPHPESRGVSDDKNEGRVLLSGSTRSEHLEEQLAEARGRIRELELKLQEERDRVKEFELHLLLK